MQNFTTIGTYSDGRLTPTRYGVWGQVEIKVGDQRVPVDIHITEAFTDRFERADEEAERIWNLQECPDAVSLLVWSDADTHIDDDTEDDEVAMGDFVCAVADEVKRRIAEDMAESVVPSDVASFAELHDYVDANMYLDGAVRAFGWNPHYVGQDSTTTEVYDVMNLASDLVDQWLKERSK